MSTFKNDKQVSIVVEEEKSLKINKLPMFLKPRTFNCCPTCKTEYDSNFSQEGWAEIEKKEFKISGLCSDCQKEFFK